MARPKSWFTPSEFNQARKRAKELQTSLYKFARNTRSGVEKGYYVGTSIPSRLASAEVVEKKV